MRSLAKERVHNVKWKLIKEEQDGGSQKVKAKQVHKVDATWQMTNTAEEGELCIYTGHSIGRFSDSSMRYDSHQACTRCVAGAREGRISLNIDTLLKKERKRALKFWSQVEIGQS